MHLLVNAGGAGYRPDMPAIVIIGAGFGGIGTGIGPKKTRFSKCRARRADYPVTGS